MNRVIAVAVTLATAAAAVTAALASDLPAMAAARPASAQPAARVLARATTAAERASLAEGQAQAPGLSSATIGSMSEGGKYVTVVHCAGQDTPPPIQLGQPGTPLTASGTGPSAGILATLSKPNPYKTVYTCTVTVEAKTPAPRPRSACELAGSHGKACNKSVTLNTGFGGMASQVKGHHPAG